MSNKYHAGTEYTNEQREQLDAAFQVWIDAESVNEYHGYGHEPARDDAETAYQVYHALIAKFDAANVPTKRLVAAGNQHGFTSVSTAQMVAAAASDDPEMVTEMSKVKNLVYSGRLAVVHMMIYFYPVRFKMEQLFAELEEAAELSDLDETYAAASNRYGY